VRVTSCKAPDQRRLRAHGLGTLAEESPMVLLPRAPTLSILPGPGCICAAEDAKRGLSIRMAGSTRLSRNLGGVGELKPAA
jgi:hypothetical protein